MSDIIVTMGGVDVTDVALEGSWTPRLNRPAQAQIKTNMEAGVTAVCGDLLKIELLVGTNWEIVFHGPILMRSINPETDEGMTVYNAQDHMELWQHRPVRDSSGDFSKPNINNLDGATLTGPSMLEAMLNNTQNAGGGPPDDAEGPIFLDLGAFAGGGVNLTGAPVDWPMNIDELFALLVSTGQLDAIITYTDPGGGVTGTIDAYNGDYGDNLASSVVFQYGMGAHNIRSLRYVEDMTNVVNKYWLYGGPRIQSAADPAGDQHWCFNVTGDDTGLANPPGGDTNPYVPGASPLGDRIQTSRLAYGVRMLVDIFDAYDDNCIQGIGTPGRDLFRRRWQVFSWATAVPRTLVHITPARETEIGSFHIGDLVLVEADAVVAGGFSGVQRVYGYTVSWDQDGVLALSELQTSADMEGL